MQAVFRAHRENSKSGLILALSLAESQSVFPEGAKSTVFFGSRPFRFLQQPGD